MTFRIVWDLIKQKPISFLVTIVFLPIVYYGLLLTSMMVTFENYPNYINAYDWFGNTFEIFRATPSFMDAIKIVSEEWLLEIGYMNYEYGFGISEWSLNIMPFKYLLVVALAALLVVNFRLYKQTKALSVCYSKRKKNITSAAGAATTGLGGTLIAMGSMTMFWVVCCASPSWVVGLAMLGWISVPSALALESYESLVLAIGFLFILISTFIFLARIKSALLVDESVRQEKTQKNFKLNATRGIRHAG